LIFSQSSVNNNYPICFIFHPNTFWHWDKDK
jgi:hypothetical protein